MHVVVFGATGAIGRQAVPALLAAGHEVTAVGRTTRRHADLMGTGARIVVGDLLEPDVVAGILDRNQPDAVVHIATALPDPIDPKHPDRDFATTNRLRSEGTRILVEQLRRLDRPVRLVTAGIAFLYEPGDGLADESAPLWSTPPKRFRVVVEALAEQERLTREAGGVSLRFGHLYGPGTSFDRDGSFVTNVRNRKMPLVGGGNAVFSFTHTTDAATAIVAAVSTPGIDGSAFNVVDDTPTPVHDWVPWLANRLGARPPQKVPAGIAKLAAGGWGVAYLNELRGATNTAAKAKLGWRPRYASWYDGMAHDLADKPADEAGPSKLDTGVS
jgi:nucleoside-diphosphate-sugar epimerase